MQNEDAAKPETKAYWYPLATPVKAGAFWAWRVIQEIPAYAHYCPE